MMLRRPFSIWDDFVEEVVETVYMSEGGVGCWWGERSVIALLALYPFVLVMGTNGSKFSC